MRYAFLLASLCLVPTSEIAAQDEAPWDIFLLTDQSCRPGCGGGNKNIDFVEDFEHLAEEPVTETLRLMDPGRRKQSTGEKSVKGQYIKILWVCPQRIEMRH